VTDPVTVRVQRLMPAVPDVVFDEWLDPEALAEWMCPRPDRCVAVSVDPSVGGRIRLDVAHDGAVVVITGRFLTIDRPRLLRFTWSNSNWADPTVASLVEVTFDAADGGETLMAIEHSLLPAEEFDSFDHGWITTFAQLAAALSPMSQRALQPPSIE
jgi:uncharacterized protein YndB with AHSA1/START domain